MTWVSTRLKYVCVDSGQYGLNISSDSYVDTGPRLLRTSDISPSGELRNDVDPVYVDAKVELRHQLREGDILFSRSGTLGRSFLVPEGSKNLTFAGYLVRFRPKSGLDPRFLKYFSDSITFQEEIASNAVSSTIQNFNAERYANIPISVPDFHEQCRISDFLDSEIGRIGRLLNIRRSQLQIFDERESSIISEHLVPGSTSHASKEFPWPWLPHMPEFGRLVRLGYLCQVQGGITVDASRESSEADVTRPYLRVANVKADRLDLDSVSEITVPKSVADGSTLQSGDVLMTEGGDIDKLGRGTVWNGELPGALHQNHVFALRPDPERLDAEYLALLTRSLHGRCYFEATGVKSTNLASTSSSKVKSFPVPFVSLKEQRRVVAEVKDALAGIGRLRVALVRQIELLEERKRALITAAVTGQIDVTTARGADLS